MLTTKETSVIRS